MTKFILRKSALAPETVGNNPDSRKKIRGITNWYNYCDAFILIISALIVFLMSNYQDIFSSIGLMLIIISLYIIFKVRSNKKMVFLFSIIGFINISLGYSDFINKGLFVADWQLSMRATEYNVHAAKSILLFLVIVNMFLTKNWIDKKLLNVKLVDIDKKYNPIISYVGIAALYTILISGYSTEMQSSTTYTSNTNPLYEYAVVIYAIVWMFSGNKNKTIKVLLAVYAISYTLYSLYYGDRSAAFMMLLLHFILVYENKISIKRLFILAISAILIANFIAGVRSGMSLDFASIAENAKERGVQSDTVSYSYYAGITITALHHIDRDLTTDYFLNYLRYIISGVDVNSYGSMAEFTRENYSSLWNWGGGFFVPHFYSWLGYPGVILSAIILGLILRKVYSSRGNYALIFQILIIVFSLRWYLYNPTTLFRGIFIISTVLLFLCNMFDDLVRKRKGFTNIR